MARGVAGAWARQTKAAAKAQQGVTNTDDVIVLTCLGHAVWIERRVVRGQPDPGCSACRPSDGRK